MTPSSPIFVRDDDCDEQGLPEKREGPSCAKLGDQEIITMSTITVSTIIITFIIVIIFIYIGVHCWGLQQRNK